MTFRASLRAVLIVLLCVAGATTVVAAQATVAIGAHVPGYCKVGAVRAVFDLPVVVTVDEAGDAVAKTPAISVPGVLCNSAAVIRAVLKRLQPQGEASQAGSSDDVRVSTEVRFAGATARVALDGGAAQRAQTDAPAKGALTIMIRAQCVGTAHPAAGVYVSALHIELSPR